MANKRIEALIESTIGVGKREEANEFMELAQALGMLPPDPKKPKPKPEAERWQHWHGIRRGKMIQCDFCEYREYNTFRGQHFMQNHYELQHKKRIL
jgi:hypothetical protein